MVFKYINAPNISSVDTNAVTQQMVLDDISQINTDKNNVADFRDRIIDYFKQFGYKINNDDPELKKLIQRSVLGHLSIDKVKVADFVQHLNKNCHLIEEQLKIAQEYTDKFTTIAQYNEQIRKAIELLASNLEYFSSNGYNIQMEIKLKDYFKNKCNITLNDKTIQQQEFKNLLGNHSNRPEITDHIVQKFIQSAAFQTQINAEKLKFESFIQSKASKLQINTEELKLESFQHKEQQEKTVEDHQSFKSFEKKDILEVSVNDQSKSLDANKNVANSQGSLKKEKDVANSQGSLEKQINKEQQKLDDARMHYIGSLNDQKVKMLEKHSVQTEKMLTEHAEALKSNLTLKEGVSMMAEHAQNKKILDSKHKNEDAALNKEIKNQKTLTANQDKDLNKLKGKFNKAKEALGNEIGVLKNKLNGLSSGPNPPERRQEEVSKQYLAQKLDLLKSHNNQHEKAVEKAVEKAETQQPSIFGKVKGGVNAVINSGFVQNDKLNAIASKIFGQGTYQDIKRGKTLPAAAKIALLLGAIALGATFGWQIGAIIGVKMALTGLILGPVLATIAVKKNVDSINRNAAGTLRKQILKFEVEAIQSHGKEAELNTAIDKNTSTEKTKQEAHNKTRKKWLKIGLGIAAVCLLPFIPIVGPLLLPLLPAITLKMVAIATLSVGGPLSYSAYHAKQAKNAQNAIKQITENTTLQLISKNPEIQLTIENSFTKARFEPDSPFVQAYKSDRSDLLGTLNSEKRNHKTVFNSMTILKKAQPFSNASQSILPRTTSEQVSESVSKNAKFKNEIKDFKKNIQSRGDKNSVKYLNQQIQLAQKTHSGSVKNFPSGRQQ